MWRLHGSVCAFMCGRCCALAAFVFAGRWLVFRCCCVLLFVWACSCLLHFACGCGCFCLCWSPVLLSVCDLRVCLLLLAVACCRLFLPILFLRCDAYPWVLELSSVACLLFRRSCWLCVEGSAWVLLALSSCFVRAACFGASFIVFRSFYVSCASC